MIPLAMALMAGGVYRRVKQDQAKEEADREDRAAVVEERNFKRSERDRAVAERNRVADAYAPVGMVDVMQRPHTADDRDVGTPGTDLVATGAKRVGNQTFGPGQVKEAEAAVAAANDPEAQTERASRAMLSMGNVAGAQQLRTGARQEKLAGLQLDEMQQKRLAQAFDDALQPLASHDAIAETVSGSNLGGALKLRAAPSADGKSVEYQVVGADGSTKPTGYSFSNDPRGLLEAKAAMSKLTPVTQKLEYLHKQDVLKRQEAKDAADTKLKQDDLDRRQPLIDSQVRENNARARYYEGGGSQAGKAAPVERMDEPDKMAYQGLQRQRGAVEKRIGQIEDAILKSQADGMWDEASPNAQAMRAQLKAQQESLGALTIKETTLMRKYQGAAAPDPYGMRASTTTRPATPMEAIAQDMAASGVHTADVDLQGVRTRVGAPAGAAARPAPAPAAAAAPVAPAAMPRGMADLIPGSGGVQAPPPTGTAPAAVAPAGPQPFQQFLAANITTPQGKSAILRRVRTELPQIQQSILADARALQTPGLTPQAKATLEARIAANQAVAETMQRFVDGNPGLTP